MKNIRKAFLIILGLFIVFVLVALTYIKTMLPNVGDAPNMKVETSAAQIERGKYLANHVTVCIDCHSNRDWTLYSGPIISGTEGKGGEIFDQKYGFPGKFIAPNITPFSLKNWTDGEIFRAVTTGVSKDGRALFSLMPAHNYGKLDENDIKAIIAYLRSLTPIEHKTETSKPDFPFNFIINTIPKPAQFSKIPDKLNKVEYGKYLVTAAGCYDCHTKQEKGKFIGEPFAGGMEFKLSEHLLVRSPNITPDKETGIGFWDQTTFISKFKAYNDSTIKQMKVAPDGLQTPMPWTMYAGMTDEDLAAIYAYLQQVKSVKNQVVRFEN